MTLYAQRHLVWLDDPHQAITEEMLLTHPEEGAPFVERFRLYRGRSLLPHAEIVMENPGFARFAPGAPRSIAIVESVDGTMATARVLCRGVIRDLPSDLGQETVTIALECYPEEEELADAKDAVARARIAADSTYTAEYTAAIAADPSAIGAPFRDGLFGRLARIGDDLIENRTLHYRYDPVTWAVSVHDDDTVTSSVNIGTNYEPESFQRGIKKGAVKQVKMKVIADLQTEYSGICDIAKYVNTFIQPSSLTGYQQNMQTSLGVGFGWSMPVQPSWSESRYLTGAVWTGDIFRITYRIARQTNIGTTAAPIWQTSYDPPFTLDHWRRQYYDYTKISFTRWQCRYEYRQARREIAELTLDVPIQDITGVKQVLTLPTVTLSDLYSVFLERYVSDSDADPENPEPIAIYEEGRTYAAGERVTVNGLAYEALSEVTGFWLVRITSSTSALASVDPRWKALNISAPIRSKEQMTFFDQPRGIAALAHAFIVMRTKALDLMMDSVTLTIPRRDDFPRFDEHTEVHFLIPGSPYEPLQAARGWVKEVTEELADDGDTITLTIELGKGTGIREESRVARIDRYARGSSYYPEDSAFIQRGTDFLTAGPDIEFSIEPEELIKPIDPTRLWDPLYSVLDVTYSGSHTQQIAAAEAQSIVGYAPINVPVTGIKPVDGGGGTLPPTLPTTKVNPNMRALTEQRTIERRYVVPGQLLYAPRGINPIPGESP